MASLKERHQTAVANRLIKNLALPAMFVREGDHIKNEPDVIYSYQGELLGIEVGDAYYSNSLAKGQWDIARRKIDATPRTVIFWDVDSADDTICAQIQKEVDKKCSRKPYSGVDRVWLCVEQQALIIGERDMVLECVKRLRIPTGHGFEKIFLHYLAPDEGGQWHSIELWPEQPQG
jgi:hypothetical protein